MAVADAYSSFESHNCHGYVRAGDLSGGLPGSNVTRDNLPNGPKPGDLAKNLPGNPADKAAGQVCCSQGLGNVCTISLSLSLCHLWNQAVSFELRQATNSPAAFTLQLLVSAGGQGCQPGQQRS